MAQQPDNQTQNQQPWTDPWQQQQQANQGQQQNTDYTSQAYGSSDSNYSYYQYPQQAGDQSYYQNYYQYPTATSSAPSGTSNSSSQQQYQYDYGNYDYSSGNNYDGYGDYLQYSQQQQARTAAGGATASQIQPSNSQYPYNNNSDSYYYSTTNNNGKNPWSNSNQAPPSTSITTNSAALNNNQLSAAAPQLVREAPSYIKVTPTAKPKPKPMMMMIDKKSGKPNKIQDISSSTTTGMHGTDAFSPQPPVPKPTSAGSIQQTVSQSTKPPSMESWPPSLKQYVEEVFNNCIPKRRDEAENELRKLILEKHREGTLISTDWADMDLPLACGSARFRKSSGKKQENGHGYQNSSILALSSRKRKDQTYTEEKIKRINRQRRFEVSANDRIGVTEVMQRMDLNKSIIGTANSLEKNYFRLTSAPDPSTVRPPKVLKKTLELLKTKWRDEQNYTYICDQFKSMRQDLTVQRIRDEFTVTVYEIHARIALEKGDLGEYNQCQSQLKQLYAMGIKGNVMEFTGYRILYYLHTQNWSDINSFMFELTKEQKENALVKHALHVRSALSTSNYHQFFKLYRVAPQMGGYLMDQFVERERVRSLLILCKAFRPTMQLAFIKDELAFESQHDLVEFLKSHNACILTQDKQALDTKAALKSLGESSKQFNKVDIKGQI